MKQIIIQVHDGNLKDLIFIDSEEYDFTYGNDIKGHGLQCRFEEGTKEYEDLKQSLDNIADWARRIDFKHKLKGE
ncbi:MAG: hypothetical protein GX053_12740 [Tissierella sp.]|nr:hypothetical protein [Tissierella sp.]